jgi:Tat protein translocase TatC
MNIVLMPHFHAMQSLNFPVTIQVLRYEESFFCHLKVAIIAALILTMPFFLYQLWLFVATGLFEHERRYLRVFFFISVIFFAAGVLFGYFILIPLGLQFLGSYGTPEIQVGFTLSSYISLFFVLTFVCGVIFELPLVMLFLVKLNIVKSRFYIEHWRHFVLGAFIFAAVATPPDVVTQLLMAAPIILLYFSGIFVCQFVERIQEIKKFLTEPN